ncbi:hypothetical protein QP185_20815 [Sphingomonas aerolata]|uniref:hypothetical protein n=1 Tax=Sphingomonas aerolata TaxID=185951 RepID=UPI002FDFBB12
MERDSKVRVIYKDWPIFGPPSERAASIALACAEQEIYPAIHRQLMTDSRIIDDDMLRRRRYECWRDWQRATTWLAYMQKSSPRACVQTAKRPIQSV